MQIYPDLLALPEFSTHLNTFLARVETMIATFPHPTNFAKCFVQETTPKARFYLCELICKNWEHFSDDPDSLFSSPFPCSQQLYQELVNALTEFYIEHDRLIQAHFDVKSFGQESIYQYPLEFITQAITEGFLHRGFSDEPLFVRMDVFQCYFQGAQLQNAREKTIAREIHGGVHGTRVALYSIVLINILRALNIKWACRLTEKDLRRIFLAGLFHDAGRKSDDGKDDNRDNAKIAALWLKQQGATDEDIKIITEMIANKDFNPKDKKDKANQIYWVYDLTTEQFKKGRSNESIINLASVLGGADCLDILRSLQPHIGFIKERFFLYQLSKQFNHLSSHQYGFDQFMFYLLREANMLLFKQGDLVSFYDAQLKHTDEYATSIYNACSEKLTHHEHLILNTFFNDGYLVPPGFCIDVIEKLCQAEIPSQLLFLRGFSETREVLLHAIGKELHYLHQAGGNPSRSVAAVERGSSPYTKIGFQYDLSQAHIHTFNKGDSGSGYERKITTTSTLHYEKILRKIHGEAPYYNAAYYELEATLMPNMVLSIYYCPTPNKEVLTQRRAWAWFLQQEFLRHHPEQMLTIYELDTIHQTYIAQDEITQDEVAPILEEAIMRSLYQKLFPIKYTLNSQSKSIIQKLFLQQEDFLSAFEPYELTIIRSLNLIEKIQETIINEREKLLTVLRTQGVNILDSRFQYAARVLLNARTIEPPFERIISDPIRTSEGLKLISLVGHGAAFFNQLTICQGETEEEAIRASLLEMEAKIRLYEKHQMAPSDIIAMINKLSNYKKIGPLDFNQIFYQAVLHQLIKKNYLSQEEIQSLIQKNKAICRLINKDIFITLFKNNYLGSPISKALISAIPISSHLTNFDFFDIHNEHSIDNFFTLASLSPFLKKGDDLNTLSMQWLSLLLKGCEMIIHANASLQRDLLSNLQDLVEEKINMHGLPIYFQDILKNTDDIIFFLEDNKKILKTCGLLNLLIPFTCMMAHKRYQGLKMHLSKAMDKIKELSNFNSASEENTASSSSTFTSSR